MAMVSEMLRKTIAKSGLSRFSISRATGIDQAALSRFMNRQVGLNTTSVDILAKYFGLELVHKTKKGRR